MGHYPGLIHGRTLSPFNPMSSSSSSPSPGGSPREAFAGTAEYVATEDLQDAVNAALVLERPLLIKGEPGTGKTVLAEEVAKALGRPLYAWTVKSTTTAQQGLYEYDAVARLRDSQLGKPEVENVAHYIRRGKIWQAFESPEPAVLLIDEVDKADIEFPNDLLQELDRMAFDVLELDQRVEARHRPLVVITSNSEKDLPDAFLRRCLFHYIRFPDAETMERIVRVHHPDLDRDLIVAAMRLFYGLRDWPGLRKKPSTSELIDWIKLLILDRASPEGLNAVNLREAMPPHLHALVKSEVDLSLLSSLGGRF